MKIKRWFQKLYRGFSDDELLNLDHTIAKFVLPRLEKFKEVSKGSRPASYESEEDWQSDLTKIIQAMEIFASNDFDRHDETFIQEGLELFGKNFLSLWY